MRRERHNEQHEKTIHFNGLHIAENLQKINHSETISFHCCGNSCRTLHLFPWRRRLRHLGKTTSSHTHRQTNTLFLPGHNSGTNDFRQPLHHVILLLWTNRSFTCVSEHKVCLPTTPSVHPALDGRHVHSDRLLQYRKPHLRQTHRWQVRLTSLQFQSVLCFH